MAEPTQNTTPNPNGNGTTASFQQLKQASDSVRAKHGGPRPGSGRKPGGKNSPRGVASAPVENQEEAFAAPTVDAEFVSKTISSLLRVVDSVSVRRTRAMVRAITEGDDNLAREFAAEVAMSEDEVEMVAGTSAIIFQKYAILGQYAPEGLLLLWLASYGSRQMVTHNKIKELAAYAMKLKAEAKARSEN